MNEPIQYDLNKLMCADCRAKLEAGMSTAPMRITLLPRLKIELCRACDAVLKAFAPKPN